MRIEKINNSSFKAIPLNKTNVGKLVKDCYPLYEHSSASFVKIEPFNEQDIKALKDTAKYWQYGNLATNIYYAAYAVKNGSKSCIIIFRI